MADRRQTSKQRRAARNRARREALNARRENAASLAARSGAGSGSTQPRSSGSANSATGSSGGVPQARADRLGIGPNRRPGDLAILLALVFAVPSFIALLFFPVSTDDRGDPIPARFGGLTLEVRSALTGDEVVAEDTGIIDAYGAQVLLLLALPLLVVAAVYVLTRNREQRSTVLTVGAAVLVLLVILPIGFSALYIPSLIALVVASFQVRRLELPGRMAQRARAADRRRAGRRGAIDVEEAEPDDEDVDDDDVLAELEAELAREAEADEAGGSGEGTDEDGGGRGGGRSPS